MSDEFLGLGGDAWAGVAAIAATAAVIPPSIAWCWRRYHRPSLWFDTKAADQYSGWVSGDSARWYIRLPLHNKSSVQSAENVEVLVKAVSGHQTIPMRLVWAHSSDPTARIAQGTFRLLDVAVCLLGTHAGGAPFTFAITGEAGENSERIPACSGDLPQSLLVELLVSADGIPTEATTLEIALTGNLERPVRVSKRGTT